MTTWTVAFNGEIKTVALNGDTKLIGSIKTFSTKKACQAYIDEVYFGAIKDLLVVKPVKIKIEIV